MRGYTFNMIYHILVISVIDGDATPKSETATGPTTDSEITTDQNEADNTTSATTSHTPCSPCEYFNVGMAKHCVFEVSTLICLAILKTFYYHILSFGIIEVIVKTHGTTMVFSHIKVWYDKQPFGNMVCQM